MTESLFARRLRKYRNAAGEHGRLTQEQLAGELGVSVDAIGKYERSLSFIRGDLESRLTERLGWSRETVLACREDWETRSDHSGRGRYRLMDNTAPDAAFGGSLQDAVIAMVEMAGECLGALPQGFDANPDVFVGSYLAFPEHWAMVLSGDEVVAKWSLPFLLPEDVELFRRGELIESTLTADRLRRPLLPGRYYGYCPALVVAPGHEAAAHLLLQSFVQFVEDMVRRDVMLEAISTISVSDAGAQFCRDLGMTRLCSHALHPDFGCWEIAGRAIASSIFGRRSRVIGRAYADEFGGASNVSSRR